MNAAMLSGHRARLERAIADCTQARALIDDGPDFYGRWIARGRRPREQPETAAGSQRTRR